MYQRILVPVDGSPTSKRGLGEAIDLAKLNGARLRLIHVLDLFVFAMGAEGAYVGDAFTQLRQAGEEILAAARAQVEAAGVGVETVLRETTAGRVSDLIVEEAAQWQAELIVMGTHGRRGVSRLALGSDAEAVARTAPVPLLLVRNTST
jgi:nucleotide-binding universal stress UspA family protein